MRIVIDMQGAQTESRFRGIGRYTMSFVQAVVRNRGEHEVILVLNGLFPDTIEPMRAAFDGIVSQENIRVWSAPNPEMAMTSGNESYRIVAEIMREAFLASLSPDVIHLTSLFEGYNEDAVTSIGRFDKTTPVSVSVYDLIPFLNQEQYFSGAPSYELFYFRKIEDLKRANCFLAISNSSRLEALANLPISEDKIINVSTAIEPNFKPIEIDTETATTLLAGFGISRCFVLYTGGADERKNLSRLVQAFASLPAELRNNYQILLAGRMPRDRVDALIREAKTLGLNKDAVCFSGYITDEELVQLYNLCSLYIFPSIHEGFGLPVLEAMACGAPVIAANTSSLPEVIGFEDALFDPFDVKSIAGKIQKVLTDKDFCAAICEHGILQVKKFSWDVTASHAIKQFSQCVEKNLQNKPKQNSQDIIDALLTRIANVDSIELLADAQQADIALSIAENFQGNGREPRLYVDISELAQRDSKTGVQRVTRSILNALLAEPPAGYVVEPVYATCNESGYRYAASFMRQFFTPHLTQDDDFFIDAHPGDIFLGLDLQHHVVIRQKAILDTFYQRGIQVLFVVYDLLPILQPQVFPPGAAEGHEQWLTHVTRYDGVICISKSVADEVVDWLSRQNIELLRPLQVSWFHLGADIHNSSPTKGIPEEASIVLSKLEQRESFLMVGTIEPRKGYTQVLNGFEKLWTSNVDVNLVIVGKQGWMVDNLMIRLREHPELGQRLFWLEGISDEFLEKIYAASSCLIAASKGEGFGLPLIEAAQHGLPIIARDISVFREVAGEHAWYFSGMEADDLANAVKSWLELLHKNKHPCSSGLKWLTWYESSKQIKEILIPG